MVQIGLTVMPADCMSTSIMETPRCLGALGSVRVASQTYSERWAPEVKRLVPLRM